MSYNKCLDLLYYLPYSITMKCPQCGYKPPKGRPKKIDDQKVKSLKKQGKSLSEIAARLGVTKGAIQASIKRGLK